MDEKLISILEQLGFDVIKQGTLDANEDIPQAYFTFWNWQSTRDNHYDNKHRVVIYYYQIQFFSDDVAIVDETVARAVELLESNGFNLEDEPTDGYSDIPNYTGKSFEINIEVRRN